MKLETLGAILALPFLREDPNDYTEAEIEAGALAPRPLAAVLLFLFWPLYAAAVLFFFLAVNVVDGIRRAFSFN
jgi:hypothetical protein